jgi:hypothetical protein
MLSRQKVTALCLIKCGVVTGYWRGPGEHMEDNQTSLLSHLPSQDPLKYSRGWHSLIE